MFSTVGLKKSVRSFCFCVFWGKIVLSFGNLKVLALFVALGIDLGLGRAQFARIIRSLMFFGLLKPGIQCF